MRKLGIALLMVFGLLGAPVAVAQISQPGPNSAQRLGATWTVATVALNGSSQTLLAASVGVCKSMIVYNPSANASIWIDLSGGVVASETGIKVAAGTWYAATGSMGPCSTVTVIGTNTQSVYVWSAS
jgi:hypothetical protein